MSTDWGLYSPSLDHAVTIGSIGLGGVQVFLNNPAVVEFIRTAIEEHLTDIVLIDEHALEKVRGQLAEAE